MNKKQNILNSNFSGIRKGCADVFNAFLVDGSKFDGYYDMPIIHQQNYILPKALIAYDKTHNHLYKDGEFVHFYLDDQKFDGSKGIWNALKYSQINKKGFDLKRFDGAAGIISPDFSLYMDMPRAMQIWNIYRSRAIGCYLTSLGYYVIPNVRWTDEESYKYAFDGLSDGMILAVGTLGCSKTKKDKSIFINGFVELIKRKKPIAVVIYGAIFKELQILLDEYQIGYKQFDSDISIAFRS